MITRATVAVALFAAVASALAESTVDDLFAAIGLTWGAMLDDVRAVYPGGETSLINATDFTYELNDSRPLFGLDRSGGDRVSFRFVDGALGSMRIEFPDCAGLAKAVQSFVGPPDIEGERVGDDETLLGTWQGTTASLIVTNVLDCMLNVTPSLL
jgi:hypothetical protein